MVYNPNIVVSIFFSITPIEPPYSPYLGSGFRPWPHKGVQAAKTLQVKV